MRDHDTEARRAVLPHDSRGLRGRSDVDLMRVCGLSEADMEGVFRRARAAGIDALVQLCNERGVLNIDALLPSGPPYATE